MVFSSLLFLFIFLPINLILYYMIKPREWKNMVLIVSSLIFYAWGEPLWVTLLLFSSVVDFFHGKIAEKYRGQWQAKGALASSLIINLGLLITFKYSGMIVDSFNALTGLQYDYQGFSLPIGISFYTFQTISYVFDVYRGEVKAQRSFLKFLMFVSLFHQLVAGPIVRYKDIAYEIENRVFNKDNFARGIERFVIGLSKKVIFANTAGDIGRTFLEGDFTRMSAAGFWLGMLLFGFQIYFDFSGYSDMAIGLGKMFGFTYKENFNYPYISKSASEFWRRWHISLGSFFRDYLYIPLGGNRHHHIRNILIVWFLTGLWHGASWNFVLWGLYYGILITIERLVTKYISFKKVPDIFGYLYMFVITIFGWTLFYFEDLGRGVSYMQGLLRYDYLWDTSVEIVLMNNLLFIILALICVTPIPKLAGQRLIAGIRQIRVGGLYDYILYPVGVIGIFLMTCVLLVGQSYNPFLYFRF